MDGRARVWGVVADPSGRLLLLESAGPLARLLVGVLSREGHEAAWRPDGSAIDDLSTFDLVLLGRTPSERDGARLLDRLGGGDHPRVIPALRPSLTGQGRDLFANRDLAPALKDCAARVRQHLSRPDLPDGVALRWGDLLFSLHPQFIAAGEREITLTRHEGHLLALLMSRGGELISTATLRGLVFGRRASPDTNVVEVHLSRLRGKLKRAGSVIRIETLRGQGYVLFWTPPATPGDWPAPIVVSPHPPPIALQS